MKLQTFLRLPVIIDGVTQLLLRNARVGGDLQLQEVETMAGLAGFTPGAKRITISCDYAVPVSGPEFDPIAEGGEDNVVHHEIQIPYGTKTIVTEGAIRTWEISGGVNESITLGFEFTGSYQKVK